MTVVAGEAIPDALAEPVVEEPTESPTTGPARSKRFRLWLLVITLAGLALRWGFVLTVQRHIDLGAGDSYYYHRGAQLLVDGHGFVAPQQWDQGIHMQAASHPPVYLLYLAFFTLIGLGTPVWHMLASCLLGAGSVALCGLLGRRLGGDRVGLIAAALAALYPQLWVNDGMVMSETAAIFFGLLALLAAYRFSESRTPRRALVMGLAIAVAALSRSELILLAPLVAVPLCLAPRGDPWWPRFGKLVLAGLGALVLIGPWVGYNLSRFDHPVYLSAGLDITQAVSNCDDTYSGQFLGYWSYNCQIPIDEAAQARGLNKNEESERSLYMGEAVRSYVKEHKSELPKVVLARLGRITGVYRGAQQIDFDSFSEARPWTVAELAAWGYWTLAPLAIFGAFIARRKRYLIYPLLAVVATVIFAVVITFAGTRYRAPAEPVIVLFAAVFLNAAIPRRKESELITGAGGGLLAGTMSPLVPDAPAGLGRSAAASPVATAPATVPEDADPGAPETRVETTAATSPAEVTVEPARPRRHLPNIDGVRAIAAIAVLTSHVAIATGAARPGRGAGFLQPLLPRLDIGVAIFFVLSGYLLFRPFARAVVNHRPGPAVRPYLLRRFLRIFPLYLLVLGIQIAINSSQQLDPDRFGSFPSPVHLFAFATLTHIYHPSTAIGPVGQAWSLGTEVSFYVFLPIFAALLAIAARRIATPAARIRLVAWSLGGLAVISLITKAVVALASGPTSETRGMITTWLPYNLDLFAMGMALALATVAWELRPEGAPSWTGHRRLPLICWGGAAVAFWVVSTQLGLHPDHLTYTDSQLFTRTTLYGVVGLLVLAPAVLGPQGVGRIRWFLSTPVMVALGLASYGIYLWHQLIGGEYYALLRHQIFNSAFWPAYIAILSASIAISLLTYRLVEAPIQRLSARWSATISTR